MFIYLFYFVYYFFEHLCLVVLFCFFLNSVVSSESSFLDILFFVNDLHVFMYHISGWTNEKI